MSDNDTIEGEFESTNGNSLVAAGGGVAQRVQTNYTTAVSVQKPRELNVVNKRILQESRLMGEAAYYGWGAGKDKIEGPSQALAYAVARCWGNCAVDQLPIEETPDAWLFTSVFVDVETGFTLTRKFRQSKKWTVHGKFDTERKDDIRFQIGQTKGDRNVILKAIPKWLVDQAMDAAKAGVREKLEKFISAKGLPAAIEICIKELSKSGVKEDRIASKFGIAKASALTLDDLVIIRGDISALQQGQETAETLYPTTEAADIAKGLAERGSRPSKAPSEKKPNDTDQSGTTDAENVSQADGPTTVPQWESAIDVADLLDLNNIERDIATAMETGETSAHDGKRLIERILARRESIRGARGQRSNKTGDLLS